MRNKIPDFGDTFTLYYTGNLVITLRAKDTGPLCLYAHPYSNATSKVELTEFVPQTTADLLFIEPSVLPCFTPPVFPEHVKRLLVQWANSTTDGISNWENARHLSREFREAHKRKQKMQAEALASFTSCTLPSTVIINRYGEGEMARFENLYKAKNLLKRRQEMREGERSTNTKLEEELRQRSFLLKKAALGRMIRVSSHHYGINILVCDKDPYAHVCDLNWVPIAQVELTESAPQTREDIVVHLPELYGTLPLYFADLLVHWAYRTSDGISNWERACYISDDLRKEREQYSGKEAPSLLKYSISYCPYEFFGDRYRNVSRDTRLEREWQEQDHKNGGPPPTIPRGLLSREVRERFNAKYGVKFQRALVLHKQWLDSNGTQGERLDLSNKDLSGLHFEIIVREPLSFHRTDLRCADFSGTKLAGACFNGANLREANFRNADFTYAILSGADLTGADMEGTDLTLAYTKGAILPAGCKTDKENF
jgi:hypothetical protein